MFTKFSTTESNIYALENIRDRTEVLDFELNVIDRVD